MTWTIVTGIFSILMFLLVLFSVIYTFRTWRYNVKLDKYRTSYELYEKFVDYGFIYEELYNTKTDDLKSGKLVLTGTEYENFLKFLASIGLSLRLEKISKEDIENLFLPEFEGKIYQVISNLSVLEKKILKSTKEDLNLLINTVAEMLNNKKLFGFVEKNFSGIVYFSARGHSLNKK